MPDRKARQSLIAGHVVRLGYVCCELYRYRTRITAGRKECRWNNSIFAMEIELCELTLITEVQFLLRKKLLVTSRELDCCV